MLTRRWTLWSNRAFGSAANCRPLGEIPVNRNNARYARWAAVCLFLALSVAASWAQSQTGSTSDQTSSTTTKKSKKSKKADAATADDSSAQAADSTSAKK